VIVGVQCGVELVARRRSRWADAIASWSLFDRLATWFLLIRNGGGDQRLGETAS